MMRVLVGALDLHPAATPDPDTIAAPVATVYVEPTADGEHRVCVRFGGDRRRHDSQVYARGEVARSDAEARYRTLRSRGYRVAWSARWREPS